LREKHNLSDLQEVSMPSKNIIPFGAWRSPISAAKVASVGTGSGGLMGDVLHDKGFVYWIGPRPKEGGRSVLMLRSPDGLISDAIPPAFNARTRAHGYGGGAYCIHEGIIYFSNFDDQRVYRLSPGKDPVPITPSQTEAAAAYFADGSVTPNGQSVICVREEEAPGGTINTIVSIPTDRSSPPKSIIEGGDFYSNPRINVDGSRLAWLTWDHPRMPWDGTTLVVGDLYPDGSVKDLTPIAGGLNESIFQPEWGPDGALYFISDRSNWWNLYKWHEGRIHPVGVIEAEIGRPQWNFGFTRYAFLSEKRIACGYTQDGLDYLGIISPNSIQVIRVDSHFTTLRYLASDGGENLWFIGGNFQQAPAVVHMNMNSLETEIVYTNFEHEINPGYISIPSSIQFPTEGGQYANGLYFPPTNMDIQTPQEEKPPLIVMSHGGPTSMAKPYLQLEIQYWTSRGFAVVDVNYRGSSGYGRMYREALKSQWGVVDAQDCVHAAGYLVDQGQVDGNRLIIRGGSAGGWSTLCALTFHDVFHAGSSYYGVSDALALSEVTHKFEEYYLDSLIGRLPDTIDLYKERSPIHHVHRLSCPVIVFHGSEDKVVPLSQAETIVEALADNKLAYAYLSFEGEGHGFRQAATIERWMEAELYFYSKVFGFAITDIVSPVKIQNLSIPDGPK
jgi:dipeptidyl aminopeptidase/acylaminoacyl peptidase